MRNLFKSTRQRRLKLLRKCCPGPGGIRNLTLLIARRATATALIGELNQILPFKIIFESAKIRTRDIWMRSATATSVDETFRNTLNRRRDHARISVDKFSNQFWLGKKAKYIGTCWREREPGGKNKRGKRQEISLCNQLLCLQLYAASGLATTTSTTTTTLFYLERLYFGVEGFRVAMGRGGGYTGFYSKGENKKVTFWKHRERDFSSGSDVPLSYLDCFFLL